MSISNDISCEDIDSNLVPEIQLKNTYNQLEVSRLKHILDASLYQFEHLNNQDQNSIIRLNLLVQEKQELIRKLDTARLERDNAIGERFLLHTNTQEHPAYKELIHTRRDLEAKLFQSKLQQAQIKSNIQALKDELHVTNDSLLKKKACILGYYKELEKIAKQRDIVNDKLLRGERVQVTPAVNKSKPPLSVRSSLMPRFISKLYSTPPVSSRNLQVISKELRMKNVQVE